MVMSKGQVAEWLDTLPEDAEIVATWTSGGELPTRDYRMIVAGTNGNGEPDLFFLKVRATRAQFGDGLHYDAAKKRTQEDGYEGPFVAFDEEDDAFRAIQIHFEWELASIIDCDSDSGRYPHDAPDYTEEEWRYEVANGDTRLGYDDWVLHNRERDKGGEP